tara:strand:+ start:1667 stop:1942 length:276 start_codon:yes stop_codon:yes gene_type:complete
METDEELVVLGYDELKSEYKLTDKQIAKLDRKAQSILGNAVVMIDSALRDEDNSDKDKITNALVYIGITMEMIEKNFNEIVSENLPKEELN